MRSFKEILEGKADDLPEQAFFLAGTLDDVRENAKRPVASECGSCQALAVVRSACARAHLYGLRHGARPPVTRACGPKVCLRRQL